ncbi:MAG: phosphoadenosine phosphosulfate reductase family protein [archaeon GB-1867-005]|nr:phosphoadenosine phosphosulfate reductase family protein [Candidatus Culexmicrobium cathedralense]
MRRSSKWTIKADLRWCKNCNIPLLSPKCDLCGEVGGRIHASPPLDVRPAFEKDLQKIRKSIAEEFDDWKLAYMLIPKRKVALLNKVTYIDQADEVIVDGWTIGHCFYDPLKNKWRFKPVAEGCARIINLERGYWAQLKTHKVKLWEKIPISNVLRGNIPPQEEKFTAIASRTGSAIGVAVREGDYLKVIKVWKPQKTHIIEVNSTIKDTIKGNRNHIAHLERRAIAFIKEVSKKIGKPVIVSFSGGKDSLATLLLTLEAIGETPIMFNDTGIEMPETVSYVKEVAEYYGLKLIEASAHNAFWNSFEVYGPPARDYRWCCKICKLIPIATIMKNHFPEGSLNLVGQRKYESLARSKSPQVWKNKWMPRIIGASPIIDWTALHVWLYLIWKNAKVNPLYYMGFDRIGCWLCPSCELAEFKLVEEIHPSLWLKWERKLSSWAKLKGFPEEWVKYGFWRWQRIPGDQMKLASKVGLKINLQEYRVHRAPAKIVKIKGFEPCAGSYTIEGILDTSIDIIKVKNIAPVIGEVKASTNLGAISIKSEIGELVISTTGRIAATSTDEISAEKLFSEALKVISRSMYCTLCGSCINICRAQAISLNNPPKVDFKKCNRCGRCQEACPASSYIGKLLADQFKWQVAKHD